MTEEPLEIRLGWPGQPPVRVAVAMRTPGADFELAAGFLLSEGVLGPGQRPHTVSYCRDPQLPQEQLFNVVTVSVDEPPATRPADRFTSVSSACGVCGRQSIDDVLAPVGGPVSSPMTVSAATVRSLPTRLRQAQPVFGATGALHAAGVFDVAGRPLAVREDVGRHNAVDKVLGARILEVVDYGADSVLCVSGRVGFDIVTKAVAGQLPVIVAVGGPSSLALDLAERAGITVCGFTRDTRFVAYTHPDRIIPEGPDPRPAPGDDEVTTNLTAR